MFIYLFAYVWRTLYLYNSILEPWPISFEFRPKTWFCSISLEIWVEEYRGRQSVDWQCKNVLRIYSSHYSLLVKPREKLWFPLRGGKEEHAHTHTPFGQVYVLCARCGPLTFKSVLTVTIYEMNDGITGSN